MKKLLLLLLVFCTTLSSAQTFNRPANPDKNIGLFGGPYLQLNVIDVLEFGVVGGVNMKDIFMVGPYYQVSVEGNQFYGLYTQINFTPKEYYFTIGGCLRTGLVNHKYLSLEPALTIQHNNQFDNIKFTHQIGFTGSMVSYNFGILFGNFGMKWWQNPGFSTGFEGSRENRMMNW